MISDANARCASWTRGRPAALLGLVLIVLAACSAGDARFTDTAPAGFWMGVWHGVIAWVTLIAGLFDDSIRVHEVHNTGHWYDFGFMLGVSATCGGGSRISVGYRAPRARPPRGPSPG